MSQHFFRVGYWIALCWFWAACNQASETVSETGTDSTLVVIQGPTTLRVVNQSDQPVYFFAYSGAASLFSCEDSAGDPCQLFD